MGAVINMANAMLVNVCDTPDICIILPEIPHEHLQGNVNIYPGDSRCISCLKFQCPGSQGPNSLAPHSLKLPMSQPHNVEMSQIPTPNVSNVPSSFSRPDISHQVITCYKFFYYFEYVVRIHVYMHLCVSPSMVLIAP